MLDFDDDDDELVIKMDGLEKLLEVTGAQNQSGEKPIAKEHILDLPRAQDH